MFSQQGILELNILWRINIHCVCSSYRTKKSEFIHTYILCFYHHPVLIVNFMDISSPVPPFLAKTQDSINNYVEHPFPWEGRNPRKYIRKLPEPWSILSLWRTEKGLKLGRRGAGPFRVFVLYSTCYRVLGWFRYFVSVKRHGWPLRSSVVWGAYLFQILCCRPSVQLAILPSSQSYMQLRQNHDVETSGARYTVYVLQCRSKGVQARCAPWVYARACALLVSVSVVQHIGKRALSYVPFAQIEPIVRWNMLGMKFVVVCFMFSFGVSRS